MNIRNPVALIVSLALVGLVASVGTLVTYPAVHVWYWYTTLHKPILTPPEALFVPAWTVLYILMAVAAWRIWVVARRHNPPMRERERTALLVYVLQLLANTWWTIVFFGLERVDAGFIVIISLLGLTLSTGILFYKLDRTAGYLFVPYVLWVAFASYLNLALFLIN